MQHKYNALDVITYSLTYNDFVLRILKYYKM